ncbi:MAG: DUF4389 domain-containing protein [Rhodospirillales bacterium]|nr:DUF4389 domain-containing protein [Rhodospirillales bacterium]
MTNIHDDAFDDEVFEEKDFRDHIADPGTWMRLLYMILFGIVFEVGKFVGLVVAVVQFLFKLFSGQPNRALQAFGYSLSEYYRQIVAFELFKTEDKPYPWAEWPKEQAASEGVASEPETTAAAPASKAPKPAAAKPKVRTTTGKGTRAHKKPAQPRKGKKAEDK